MTDAPEVTSEPGETESAQQWRRIKRGLFSGLARLALYAVLFAIWAATVGRG